MVKYAVDSEGDYFRLLYVGVDYVTKTTVFVLENLSEPEDSKQRIVTTTGDYFFTLINKKSQYVPAFSDISLEEIPDSIKRKLKVT